MQLNTIYYYTKQTLGLKKMINGKPNIVECICRIQFQLMGKYS
jgi:hypothetical protein